MADVCNVQAHTHSLTSNQIDMVKTERVVICFCSHTPPAHTHIRPYSLIQMHFSSNSVNMKSSMNMRGDLLVFNITMHTSTTLIQTNTLHSIHALHMQHKTSCCDENNFAKQVISAIEITFYLF